MVLPTPFRMAPQPSYKSPYGPKGGVPSHLKELEDGHDRIAMREGISDADKLRNARYHYQPNVGGWTLKQGAQLGFKAGAFGGVALFAVIFYASGIPRVQNDILMKIPGLSKYYVKDIPASDNPF